MPKVNPKELAPPSRSQKTLSESDLEGGQDIIAQQGCERSFQGCLTPEPL